jgi:putative transposase
MDFLGQDGGRGACPLHGILRGQGGKSAKVVARLENSIEDTLAVMAPPAKYRRRMKSTNMHERLIQEVRRRERVIRIFPNEESAPRLVGALLAEINAEWQERRYLDMSEF